MNIVTMEQMEYPHPVNGDLIKQENKWHYKETLNSAGDGDAILIPGGGMSGVGIDFFDGTPTQTGNVYLTMAPTEDIVNDVPGIWIEYDKVNQISPENTAIKQNNPGGGTTILNVTVQ